MKSVLHPPHTQNIPAKGSFSFLVRPDTIRELIDAASGRRRSPQESTRFVRRLMKETMRQGRIRVSSSSKLPGKESRREERLMIRSTGTVLEVGKPLVSRDPKIEDNS